MYYALRARGIDASAHAPIAPRMARSLLDFFLIRSFQDAYAASAIAHLFLKEISKL